MTTLETGSGAKTWSLYDLWIANGKPTQIVVAAYGPATCKIDGFRWSAITGEACAAGAINLHESDGKLIGQPAGATMAAAIFSLNPSLENAVAFVSGVSLTTFGVEYWTAAKWAKAGYWIRRKAWTDTSQKIRFEEGVGTAKAVAVYQGNTITKRVVKNSDFGVNEFNAIDWLVPDAPAEIDLTDSVLSATGSWKLTHSGATTTGGGGTTGTGSTGTGSTSGSGTSGSQTINGIVVEAFDLATVCAISMTRIQLDIARGVALSMLAFGQSDFTEGQIAQGQTDLLTIGITNIINAGGSTQCAGYYRDYILSLFNLSSDGSGTTQGEPGTPGSVWYNGTTAPSSGLGIDGDYYLQAPATPYNVAVYNKQAGTWVAIFAV